MATHQAEIIAYGKGHARITYFDNEQNPTDSETFGGVKHGMYRWSVGFFRNDVKKYGFTLKNEGFTGLIVRWRGEEYDFSQKANYEVIDFWNQKAFKPSKTDAPNAQHVGNLQEDDADLQEAIRRSLLETNNYHAENDQQPHSTTAPLSSSEPSAPRREPPPFYIDVFSDDENEGYDDDDIQEIEADISMRSMPPEYGYLQSWTPRDNGEDLRRVDHDDVDLLGSRVQDGVDEEDEDLKRAIALSLQESGPPPEYGRRTPSPSRVPARATPTTSANSSSNEGGGGSTSLSSLLGQSRAEMERQRQERLKKRLASEHQEESLTIRAEKRTRANSPPTVPTPSSSVPPTTMPNLDLGTGAARENLLFGYPIKYTRATFLNTHIQGTFKESTHVSLEDLINKEHLQKAILTSFISDPQWLTNYLPSDRRKTIVLVVHWRADKGETPGHFRGDHYLPNMTEFHPPLQTMGTFHPKCMLLWYPTFFRIVISSANLVSEDWSEIVNSVYVQDFPYRTTLAQTPRELGEFGSTLYDFLQKMTLPEKALRYLLVVDFSFAKVYLVPSVQGTHFRDGEFRYGSARLSQILRNGTVRRPWSMEYQAGSVGNLTLKFLTEFYNACQGKPVEPRSRYQPEQQMPPIKVIYPTETTVQQGKLGERAGGTIVLQSKYWRSMTFPKKIMHDYVCRGSLKGYMMHTKLILARAIKNDAYRCEPVAPKPSTSKARQASLITPPVPEEPIPDNLPSWEGWFLVGSHNFSESAWGCVTKKPQGLHITIRNWELSVLCPVERADEIVDAQGLFGAMPVPYERPPRQYTSRDEPWMMDKY
ncbi:hypothetical protein BGW42_007124 [Actinomortierella wolfii]|nr:hypothetical protein BGW42_007124 [Actinomortierella wolfii]